MDFPTEEEFKKIEDIEQMVSTYVFNNYKEKNEGSGVLDLQELTTGFFQVISALISLNYSRNMFFIKDKGAVDERLLELKKLFIYEIEGLVERCNTSFTNIEDFCVRNTVSPIINRLATMREDSPSIADSCDEAISLLKKAKNKS